MATKRLEFIKPWNMTPAGGEMELDAPIADLLIKRGVAREVQTPAPAPPKGGTTNVSKRKLRKQLRNANR